jgi:DNA-binding NarL/FixJ family response regulator
MFSSRVTSLAKSSGVDVKVVGSRAALLEAVAAIQPSMVFIDLEHRDADIAEIVKGLAAHIPRPQLVGYGPHVKESLLTSAQTAGCDVVLSRGQFDKQVGAFFDSLTKGNSSSAE